MTALGAAFQALKNKGSAAAAMQLTVSHYQAQAVIAGLNAKLDQTHTLLLEVVNNEGRPFDMALHGRVVQTLKDHGVIGLVNDSQDEIPW